MALSQVKKMWVKISSERGSGCGAVDDSTGGSRSGKNEGPAYTTPLRVRAMYHYERRLVSPECPGLQRYWSDGEQCRGRATSGMGQNGPDAWANASLLRSSLSSLAG